MPDRLDLDLARVNVSGGRPLPADPPGFAALAAPRKTARGREHDVLLLCLGLRTRAPETVPAERYHELIDLAAVTFFGAPGSVTAALRQALNAVNQKLIDANVRAGASGLPVQGGLICAALRGEDFYAVQSGPGLIVVAHGLSLERFPNLPSRPLGSSVALDAQYFHTTVHEGEYACLSNALPAGWSDVSLAGLGGLATLTAVAERLRGASAGDFAALIGRFERAGTVSALQPAPLAASIPHPSASSDSVRATLPPTVAPAPGRDSVARPSSASEPSPASQLASEPSGIAPAPSGAGTDWPDLVRRAERLGEPPPRIPIIEETPPPAGTGEPSARPAPAPRPSLSDRFAPALQSIGRALGSVLARVNRGLRMMLARMMPEGALQRDGLFAIPNPVQIGAAILIPLMVVSVVALLYYQRGRAQQFSANLEQAQLEVTAARLAADPFAARPHWEKALEWLDRADQYKPNDAQAAALRAEAQGRIDEMDWVTRLDFQPLVIGGLGRNVAVKQILVAGPDVYALDSVRSRVMRLAQTPSGIYAVDPDFECSSGPVGQFTIGTLIDLGLIPGPTALGEGDAVVALDSTGGLLYCAPGVKPLATYLPAPDTSWIRPAALEVYADRLYVLDPGGNEIWQFQASGGAFTQPPTHYFTTISYDLSDVVEFTIAQGEVFLLRKDGRITDCTRSAAGEPAVCVESAPFTDPREGRISGDRLYDVVLPARLVYDPPPEPSLHLLDASTSAVYQLSLKLSLAQQFRPRLPLADPIAAVAIDSAKRFFVAAGDNVYVANRP